MASIEELRAERLKKLTALQDSGKSGFPAISRRTHELSDVIRNFASLAEDSVQVIVAGRVMSSRGQGALIFIDLYDGSAKLQAVIKLQESGEEAHEFYTKYVDTGDFIEVTGTLFTTKSGQERSQIFLCFQKHCFHYLINIMGFKMKRFVCVKDIWIF